MADKCGGFKLHIWSSRNFY